MSGRLRRLHVELAFRPEGDGQLRYTAAVDVARIRGRLALSAESLVGALGKMLQGRDIATGDADFDGRVLVRGDSAYARAALTAPVRASVVSALDAGVRLLVDRAIWTWTDRPWSQQALARVGRLAELGARLDLDPDEEVVGLLQNAVWDPHAGVRRHALTELLPQASADRADAVLQAGAAGARHEDPRVRAAAGALLAALVAHRGEWVDALGGPQLLAAVQAGGRAPAIPLLAALGRRGGPEALPLLVELSSGVFTGRDVKHAARQAAEAVRSRGEESSGALSLAPQGGGGSVALIGRPEGAVAFSD